MVSDVVGNVNTNLKNMTTYQHDQNAGIPRMHETLDSTATRGQRPGSISEAVPHLLFWM